MSQRERGVPSSADTLIDAQRDVGRTTAPSTPSPPVADSFDGQTLLARDGDAQSALVASPTIALPNDSRIERVRSLTQQIDPAAPVSVAALLSTGSAAADDRYTFHRVLGAGGMGEVRLCLDARIGRDVALKVLHGSADANSEATARFVREARVQGQLEHPAVVPVYDLGALRDGAVFFTMKRVKGATLEDALQGLRDGQAHFAEKFTRRRLLSAFVAVCHAIEYAHTRGVLHRDLKPANVMLGEFGEVHVLDWGLAKLLAQETAETRPPTAPAPADTAASDPDQGPPSRLSVDDGVGSRGHTLAGALMGTPGYMSPEQARGEVDRLDARTDVYALGAILFELLTLQPLHAQAGLATMLQSTLRGVDARPSARVPSSDVAPELESICVRATALAPGERYPSVRAMREALERFLDGDRDLEQRREMAASHVASARNAAMRAAAGSLEARAEAVREVGRALALDPQNADALGALAFVLMNAPDEVPREAASELAARGAQSRARALRLSALRYLTWLAFVPFVFVMGPRNWAVSLLALGAIAASSAFAFLSYRRKRPDAWSALGLVTLSNLAIGLLAGWFGPFMVVPGLASTNALFFATFVQKRVRVAVIAAGVLSMALPFALDLSGVLPPAYTFAHDEVTLHARMTSLPTGVTQLALLLANVALVLTPALLAGRLRDELDAAERRLFLQSWYLQQMVPAEARATLATTDTHPIAPRAVVSSAPP